VLISNNYSNLCGCGVKALIAARRSVRMFEMVRRTKAAENGTRCAQSYLDHISPPVYPFTGVLDKKSDQSESLISIVRTRCMGGELHKK
jgi:hypothetical protein